MLILTRRPGESIMIESNETGGQENAQSVQAVVGSGNKKKVITITVLRVKGGQISLGFDADESIKIFREEIYRAQEKLGHNEDQTSYDPGYISDDVDEDNYY